MNTEDGRPGADPVAAAAGGYALTEAELQAAIRSAAAVGNLRCSRCGVALQPAQARFVRQRLAHRWATLAVCDGCTPPRSVPATRAASDDLDAVVPVAPRARLGRFLGRARLAVVALEADRPAIAAAQARLGLPDGPAAEDFDPGIGPTVRALHQQYGDVAVYLPARFGVRLGWQADALELCLSGPDGSWRAPAALADLAAFRAAVREAEHALVLLCADRPLIALLCPTDVVALPPPDHPPDA